MYGLPQAGILTNEMLQRNLAKDDFGVKYVGREHAEHLMACIKKNYNISSDWNGTAYCGLTLDWDYNNRTVDLSMPG
jgi:hypothetical protein